MAKVFLIISLLASAVAGWFAYQTVQQTQKVQTTLTDTKKNLADTRTKLSKTQDQLTDMTNQYNTTKTALDAKTAEAQNLSDQVAKLTTDLQTAQADRDKALADLKTANDQLDVYKGKTSTAGTNPLQDKLNELTAAVAEKDALLKAAQAKADAAEQRASGLADKIAKHEAAQNRPGLVGQVLAVNQGWNFAVISIGDKQGAVANAQVLVKRGETLIAKLKITTVEPSTSIADIMVETLAKGQRVQPGDSVIFTGQTVGNVPVAPY